MMISIDVFSIYLLIFMGIAWLFGFYIFGITSIYEKEKRASIVSFGLGLAGLAIFSLASTLPAQGRVVALGLIISAMVVIIITFFWPMKGISLGDDTPKRRIDERDTMFARARLQPGSPEYLYYYLHRPENKKQDDHTRSKLGYLTPETKYADPYLFASARGSFFMTDLLHRAVDGPVSVHQHKLSSREMTDYLKGLAYYFGARQVGVAALEPHHIYSHVGRGTGTYGEPINLDHKFAIAFTVEMDFDMVGSSPLPPTIMESARQYVEAARNAVRPWHLQYESSGTRR